MKHCIFKQLTVTLRSRNRNCFKTNFCSITHASVICLSSLSTIIKKYKYLSKKSKKKQHQDSQTASWFLVSWRVKWSPLQIVVISTCQAVKQPHYYSEKLKRNKKEQSQEYPEGLGYTELLVGLDAQFPFLWGLCTCLGMLSPLL